MIKIVIGVILFTIGIVNPGLWPWLILCMIGGGFVGSGLADLQKR